MNSRQGTLLIIEQIREFLSLMDDAAFTQPLDLFGGSTIGQHFRHIVDFYSCLFKGAAAGYVDYCQRERDPQVEGEVAVCFAAFERIADQIMLLDEAQPLQVRPDYSTEEHVAQQLVASSLGREMMYAFDHALHHLALIRMGAALHFPHLPIDNSLGVAPSTLKYRERKAQTVAE